MVRRWLATKPENVSLQNASLNQAMRYLPTLVDEKAIEVSGRDVPNEKEANNEDQKVDTGRNPQRKEKEESNGNNADEDWPEEKAHLIEIITQPGG
jgi:hypothetical protein